MMADSAFRSAANSRGDYLIPYGAFEQKRHYQRHLGSALGIVMLGLVTLWLASVVACDSEPPTTGVVPVAPYGSDSTKFSPGPPIDRPPSDPRGAKRGNSVVAPPEREGYKPVEVEIEFTASDSLLRSNTVSNSFESGEAPGSSGQSGRESARASRGGSHPDPTVIIPVDVMPRFVYKEVPDYPRLARSAGIEGVVWVKVLVDTRGMVSGAFVAKSSGANVGFEEAALAAARLCRFSPAIQNGSPVAIWVTFAFKFELER
ncbi:MAG: energy transducer TonB [Candidatus Zixiibacteriota bacterium]